MNASRAYIGLGSNLNNPRQQIRRAFAALDSLTGCQLEAYSSLYQSKPMGPAQQPDYINAAAALETLCQPLELLEQLQAIERGQGRLRSGERWGPRTLDLDLLLYDDLQMDTEVLVIPHPGLHRRAFVLYPLAEIAPDLNVPALASLQRLIEGCPIGNLRKLEES
ncbi:MAG: 2-amino-4-hydroxy-6-hydroxymethyldihydropteridine diphosphokinase [Gammaproteobacteria bacterium]